MIKTKKNKNKLRVVDVTASYKYMLNYKNFNEKNTRFI